MNRFKKRKSLIESALDGSRFCMRSAINFIFPLYCLSCKKKLINPFYFAFCKSCFRRLGFIKGSACYRCGRAAHHSSKTYLCSQCRGTKNYLDFSGSALNLTETLKNAVHAFKYRGKDHYGYYLSALLAAKARRIFSDEQMKNFIITPVPLHSLREKKRGYNQSELLAVHLSKRLCLIAPQKVLVRQSYIHSQTALSRKERQKNIRNAFKAIDNDYIKNQSFLLIDDILTTGATLNECARVLKKAGAKEVCGLTLASVSFFS